MRISDRNLLNHRALRPTGCPAYSSPTVETEPISRGTGSSNPSPSSGESVSLPERVSRIGNPGFPRGCARLAWRPGRQRRAGGYKMAPTGGNISVAPYSSTAVPLTCRREGHAGPNKVGAFAGLDRAVDRCARTQNDQMVVMSVGFVDHSQAKAFAKRFGGQSRDRRPAAQQPTDAAGVNFTVGRGTPLVRDEHRRKRHMGKHRCPVFDREALVLQPKRFVARRAWPCPSAACDRPTPPLVTVRRLLMASVTGKDKHAIGGHNDAG